MSTSMRKESELKNKLIKTTAKASSDVALIKYWGKKDESLRLPENSSISLILDGLDTVTTVEFQEKLTEDLITIQGESEEGEASRVKQHLDRIRKLAGLNMYAKVVSNNTFPKGTGLSSSGSGFAALTYSATKAAGLDLSEKELSILSRQGSGTACRCACGGIVQWKDGDTSETSFSKSLYPSDYWDIRDVIAVVDEGKKNTSSTQGHATAQTSVFYQARQENLDKKIGALKNALTKKDFSKLGAIVEAEALEFHSILLTSHPPLVAWYPGTIAVMLEVQAMRKDGIEAYFTINTGFNVHILTTPEFEKKVQKRIEQLPLVKKTLSATIGEKPTFSSTHLF
ncbi:MAG: diphosphomevalonate decarboxylase [Patescibacteria group bacterium]